MNSGFKYFIVALSAISLAASCGSESSKGTGYQKIDEKWGPHHGYSSKQIGPDEYSIAVTGARYTNTQRVLEIALLRAAHIARERGRSHFLILKQTGEYLSTAELDFDKIEIGDVPVWLPVDELERIEPHAIIIIRLLPPMTHEPLGALSADEVIASIGPRLGVEQ